MNKIFLVKTVVGLRFVTLKYKKKFFNFNENKKYSFSNSDLKRVLRNANLIYLLLFVDRM